MALIETQHSVRSLVTHQHPRGAARVHGWQIGCIAAAVSLALSLPGCMTMHERVGKWLATPTPAVAPTPTPRVKAAVPRVYFAGTKAKLHSKPSASAPVVGELSVHEKVTRTKLEGAFGYVESSTSGLKGWVDNSQLIRHLPSGTSPAAPAPSEPDEVEPATAEPEAAEPAAPETAPTPVETAAPPAAEALTPTPTTLPAVVPPRPKATPGGVAPSIFNPY